MFINSTTTPVIPDFLKGMVTEVIQTFADLPLQSIRTIWYLFISILKAHWLFLICVFFIIVIIATVKNIYGKWGMLGSVIYNILYFGILLIIGLIFGPDFFITDFFKPLCVIILYPICYKVTRLLLDIFKTKK